VSPVASVVNVTRLDSKLTRQSAAGTFRIAAAVIFLSTVAAAAVRQTPPGAAGPARVDIPYEDARPIIEYLAATLPEQLAGVRTSSREWPSWVALRDGEIRARLFRGDEDSLLNFLLFGTSFTSRPRAVNDSSRLGGAERAAEILRGRIDDLAAAVLAPGANERLAFVRQVMMRADLTLSGPDSKPAIARYLRSVMARVNAEVQGYVRTVDAARAAADPVEEFVARSQLFQSRGLSSDTSIRADAAIDQALEGLRTAGFYTLGSVRRAAIVGPGLDFTDKAEGYDFYPPQTVQPFAVVDSLIRLKLAPADGLELTAFDVNPRVLAHITAARERARSGSAYTVQLVREADASWRPRLTDYWQLFGSRIGEAAPPTEPPANVGSVAVRAVAIRPAVVRSIVPHDLDIVLQRLELPPGTPKYDLVIATNVLVYYSPFEQALALVNIAKMLRPGGVLLANSALPEKLAAGIKSAGSTRVTYSDRPDDGDQVVWYRRQ
jgi:SAM-dependent methyltransferase